MKKRILKCIALMLVIIIALPILPVENGNIVSAAARPSLSMEKKTIIGIAASFTLNLKNAGKNVKKMTWYTQDAKVATVVATADPLTGKVTTVGKGTTNIKCKITYTDGTVVRPACKVTVKVPATAIAISNANDAVNNRHVIAVGESFDFNSTLTPNNANDKTYWLIEEKGKEFATVDSNGVVTGVKPGFFRLSVIASMTAEGVATSTVDDIINIEIVNKTANVLSVLLTDATKLTVTFDRAINPATVIGTDGKLLDSVMLVSKIDAKGISASALGTLTGALSVDGKTLTIQASNTFNGTYGIILSSKIKSLDSIALNSYNENLILTDTVRPQYVNWTVDATGLIVSLNFSEAMNFTNLQVNDAKIVSSGQTILPTTISILNTKSNYIKSADNKSLTIDLSTMAPIDQNKMFSVSLSGIKDMAGNDPVTIPIVAILQTDSTPKAQAQLITLLRSGYNTLTATFTRAIKTTGMVMLSNGEYMQGIVDPKDATKVNYTFSDTSALLTGWQEVSIGSWSSYNVSPTDTSSNGLTKRSVDFTTDKTYPILTNSVLEMVTLNSVDSYVLTLTYSKNVILTANLGSFTAQLLATNNELYGTRILNYTAIAKDNQVIINLNKDQISVNGTYTLTIPAGFVRDQYMNMSIATTATIKKDSAVSSVLPAPKAIVQSPDNASIIYVTFDKKLDETTAQNVANYSIIGTGTTVISAALIDNNTSSGATVKLTLQQGSITTTTIYPITISGITGYQNTYSVMDKYQTTVVLYENKIPNLVTAKYLYPNTIALTFDEAIKGTASFQVLLNNVNIASGSTVVGNTITITLNSSPAINSTLYVVPTQYNAITDMSGNAALIISRNVTASVQ